MDVIAERLTKLRDEKGATQEEVAEACGMSRVTLARYENGTRKPIPENLSRLAEYYGKTVDYLLGREDRTQAEAESIVEHYINAQSSRPNGAFAFSQNPVIAARESIRKDADRFGPETMSVIEGILDKLAQLDEEGRRIAESHIDFLLERKRKEGES